MFKKVKEWLESNQKSKIGRPKLAKRQLLKAVKIELIMAFILCATLILSGTSVLTGKSPLELLGLGNQNKYSGSVAYRTAETKSNQFVVSDGIGTQNVCHKIYMPTNANKNWRIHVYYKESGTSSWNYYIGYQYVDATSKEICFKKQENNKEIFRILVKWTTNITNDEAYGTSGSWKPSGWSYNSDIGRAYKDYTIDWSKITTTAVQADSITLNETSLSINVGETYELKATIHPNEAIDKTVIWSTSNKNVVTVLNGNIVGVKRGIATVTAKTKNGKTATAEIEVTEEIDVALFWGQSNMVGRAGKNKIEDSEDSNKSNMYEYIYSDIVDNYEKYKFVKLSNVLTELPPNTSYEFKFGGYNADGTEKFYLTDLSKNPTTFGENIEYISDQKSKVKFKKCTSTSSCNYALQQGSGTNMIPYFAKTYYELTGRKLVIVLAAYGGQPIEAFLPETDENGNYIYEAMIYKYNKAIEFLTNKSNNYKVQNKFYVVFQGEANVSKIGKDGYTRDDYEKNFKTVHNLLTNELDLSFGALVKTGYYPVYNKKDYIDEVSAINTAQQNLINMAYKPLLYDKNSNMKYELNSDIIEATNWGYYMYLKGIESAFCPGDNSIHFTSASLSHIGRESAIAVARKLYSGSSKIQKEILNPKIQEYYKLLLLQP